MLSAAHRPACRATEPSWGSVVAVVVGDVGDVADRVDAAGGRRRVRSGSTVEAPAAALGQARSSRPASGAWMPPAQTTRAGRDLGAVAQRDPVGA